MIIITCPNCNQQMEIVKINCKIFIHGYIKNKFKQVNPHSKLEYINQLKNNNNLLGCGAKFKYDGNNIQLFNNEEYNNY
jgi:uncharacterized protein YciI